MDVVALGGTRGRALPKHFHQTQRRTSVRTSK